MAYNTFNCGLKKQEYLIDFCNKKSHKITIVIRIDQQYSSDDRWLFDKINDVQY